MDDTALPTSFDIVNASLFLLHNFKFSRRFFRISVRSRIALSARSWLCSISAFTNWLEGKRIFSVSRFCNSSFLFSFHHEDLRLQNCWCFLQENEQLLETAVSREDARCVQADRHGHRGSGRRQSQCQLYDRFHGWVMHIWVLYRLFCLNWSSPSIN